MLGLSGLKLYIGLGMLLALVVLGATVAVLWSRLEARDAEIASLQQQLEIAAGDAARWQKAAAERQRVIDHQALTLRRLESDGAAARAIADQQAGQARAKIAQLEVKLQTLKEAAHARPQDVRDLGPIVRTALPSLRH
uniref:Sarcolemma associated protein isoform 16-like protein n=1 Tax=uncultured bacterium 878 TaxID=548895 RepID=B8R8M0_9BACT|nr:sarcolemma associated protein isoform 16-like protein [uncultured bacterium 878]